MAKPINFILRKRSLSNMTELVLYLKLLLIVYSFRQSTKLRQRKRIQNLYQNVNQNQSRRRNITSQSIFVRHLRKSRSNSQRVATWNSRKVKKVALRKFTSNVTKTSRWKSTATRMKNLWNVEFAMKSGAARSHCCRIPQWNVTLVIQNVNVSKAIWGMEKINALNRPNAQSWKKTAVKWNRTPASAGRGLKGSRNYWFYFLPIDLHFD